MAAKYDIDEKVSISGRVTEVVTDEKGTVYKVKFKANNEMKEIYFEEDDIDGEVDASSEVIDEG